MLFCSNPSTAPLRTRITRGAPTCGLGTRCRRLAILNPKNKLDQLESSLCLQSRLFLHSFAHGLRQRSPRTIKPSVSEHNAPFWKAAEHRRFEMAECGKCGAKLRRWIRIERIFLCLHAAARPHVGRTSKSLRNKPVDVNLLRNRNQIVRTMLPLPPPLAKT
jgi:hypothetical protein